MRVRAVAVFLIALRPQERRWLLRTLPPIWSAPPAPQMGRARRNWLFVKIKTDAGIYGIGEASGWPRVVETAITDLTPLLIGEDPFHIERLWSKHQRRKR